jgi:hypothetical protein
LGLARVLGVQPAGEGRLAVVYESFGEHDLVAALAGPDGWLVGPTPLEGLDGHFRLLGFDLRGGALAMLFIRLLEREHPPRLHEVRVERSVTRRQVPLPSEGPWLSDGGSAADGSDPRGGACVLDPVAAWLPAADAGGDWHVLASALCERCDAGECERSGTLWLVPIARPAEAVPLALPGRGEVDFLARDSLCLAKVGVVNEPDRVLGVVDPDGQAIDPIAPGVDIVDPVVGLVALFIDDGRLQPRFLWSSGAFGREGGGAEPGPVSRRVDAPPPIRTFQTVGARTARLEYSDVRGRLYADDLDAREGDQAAPSEAAAVAVVGRRSAWRLARGVLIPRDGGYWLVDPLGRYYLALDEALRRADPLGPVDTLARTDPDRRDSAQATRLVGFAWLLFGLPVVLLLGGLLPRPRRWRRLAAPVRLGVAALVWSIPAATAWVLLGGPLGW